LSEPLRRSEETQLARRGGDLARQFIFQLVPYEKLRIPVSGHQVDRLEAGLTIVQMLEYFQLAIEIQLFIEVQPQFFEITPHLHTLLRNHPTLVSVELNQLIFQISSTAALNGKQLGFQTPISAVYQD
jgi:hypothetical protein